MQLIFEKLAKLISEQFGIDADEITPETAFVEDLNADSLDLVELMMSIEDEFDLEEMTDTSIEDFQTVGDVVSFIKNRI